MRRLLLALATFVALAAVVFLAFGAGIADRLMNKVTAQRPSPPSAQAVALVRRLAIADLHADALLWPRDLLERHANGHVDLPRLREGHVALQVFASVTKTPRGLNYERNTGETDNITLLAVAQRYPWRAWGSLRERARWQASRLADAERRSAEGTGAPTLRIVRTASDLRALLEARSLEGDVPVGALLATEGLHPLEGRLENLDTLVGDGFRMFGVTHFFDNEVGGSAHGVSKGGLTPFGRAVVQRMDSLGVIIDVAHASPRLVDDVLAASRRPIVVSHGGVQGTCPGPRNLSDDQLRRIAAEGGLIGIGYWDGAICEPTADAFARAVKHAIAVAGEDHVALGSDFDGATTTPFDASAMAVVADALLRAGLSEPQVAKVMGENTIRLLLALLPP